MRERRLRQEVVGDAVCELREGVRGARGDHEQVGAGQVRIDVLRGWSPCQREECLLGHEPLCPGRDQRHDVMPCLDEQARDLARLVGGDPSAHAQQHPAHAGSVTEATYFFEYS